jgi:hypothetical protein
MSFRYFRLSQVTGLYKAIERQVSEGLRVFRMRLIYFSLHII